MPMLRRTRRRISSCPPGRRGVARSCRAPSPPLASRTRRCRRSSSTVRRSSQPASRSSSRVRLCPALEHLALALAGEQPTVDEDLLLCLGEFHVFPPLVGSSSGTAVRGTPPPHMPADAPVADRSLVWLCQAAHRRERGRPVQAKPQSLLGPQHRDVLHEQVRVTVSGLDGHAPAPVDLGALAEVADQRGPETDDRAQDDSRVPERLAEQRCSASVVAVCSAERSAAEDSCRPCRPCRRGAGANSASWSGA